MISVYLLLDLSLFPRPPLVWPLAPFSCGRGFLLFLLVCLCIVFLQVCCECVLLLRNFIENPQ